MKKTSRLGGLIVLSLVLTAQGGGPQAGSMPRNFVLIFDILNYTREMGDAVTYIFNQVLGPNDQLIIYTPARAYGFSKNTLNKPKGELIATMKEKLRGDSAACSSNYSIILNEMKGLARNIEGGQTTGADAQAGIKNSLTLYRQEMENLRTLRQVNEPLLMKIVDMFKTQQGQNHLVMLYEAEFRPIPNRETLSRLRAMPEIAFIVAELFASDDQKSPLDAGKFIDIFGEGKVTLHFLYIKPRDKSTVQDFKEHSADMYDVFTKIAKATGGIVETTASPEAALKSLVKAIGKSSR
ncbi:MAG: hypothetical protein NTV82_02475 [Candidatus Aminicenantes bacterium]|nr:hypothetical protein [Candidatus Aminicenantes bacterium]